MMNSVKSNYRWRTNKPLLLLLVLFSLVALVLTACSDSPTTTGVTNITNTSGNARLAAKTNSVTNSNQGLNTQVSSYDPNKTFIFGLAQEPVGFNQIGFDPANLTDLSSLMVTRQIYEGLFEFKPDSMGIRWSSFIKNVQTSADGRTYRIRLRKGILFSDGSPLDAEAVKFNFERWAGFGNAIIYHKGDFETWREFWGGFPGLLDAVQVEDRINLTIQLKTPLASFFQVLAMPQFAIVAPSSFDSNGAFQRPIGSGPYMLDQVIRSDPKSLILKTNPNYIVERQDINSIPKLPTIAVQILKANQDGLTEIKAGHISATDKIRPEDALQTDPTYQIRLRPPLNVTFLTMNVAAPPFDNPNVRKAFAYGINTTQLAGSAFLGLGLPANELLPPSSLGYQSERSSYPYDPEQAKRFLAQAGYSKGLKVDLWRLPDPRPYYPDTQKVATSVAQDLAKIGVTVNIRSEDWATFYQDRNDGNFSFFMGGWQGVNGDPDEFFHALYDDSSRANGYQNFRLSQLLAQARTQPDLAQRRTLYNQAFDIVQQDVPYIPLAFVKIPLAVRSNVEGYTLNPSGVDSWLNLSLKK